MARYRRNRIPAVTFFFTVTSGSASHLLNGQVALHREAFMHIHTAARIDSDVILAERLRDID